MNETTEMHSIQMQSLDNPTHCELMRVTADRAKADRTVIKLVKEAVDQLDAAVQAEEKVLRVPQKNPLTDQIKAADSKRDSDFMFIKNTVSVNLKNPDPDKQQTAQVVWMLIKSDNVKVSDQYERETGLLGNFLNEAEQKYAAQMKVLGLTDAVKTLRADNNLFISLMNQRTEEEGGKVIGAMQRARQLTDKAFINLRKLINAQALLGHATELTGFINYMNAELNRLKQQVLHTRGIANTGDGTTGNNNPGGDEEEPPQG
ncbi:MAG: DUF6261 family protein [Prevotellaceae bacterium]|jgi:hypothetical protein|nr:DUF6261 family protein [Prevotellaceae bacterium]